MSWGRVRGENVSYLHSLPFLLFLRYNKRTDYRSFWLFQWKSRSWFRYWQGRWGLISLLLFSLSATSNWIFFHHFFVCNTSFEISWVWLEVAEMTFVSWSYLTTWYLEAPPSKYWPVENMVVYFVNRKVVVLMSFSCWFLLLDCLSAYKYLQ